MPTAPSPSPSPPATAADSRVRLQAIRALVAEDFAAVDRCIGERLSSDVALIGNLAGYLIHSGGKRLRPLLVLLAARACGYQDSHHVTLAAVVEFIHTATLLHDDVVDGSQLRRGAETANAVWGNPASVLVGDFLYSRAFQMMVEVGSMRVMEVMADTTNTIAEGEVMQLLNCNDPDTDEARYFEVIRNKTAKLFEASARLGAILGGQTDRTEQALADYGMELGIAFQLIDDALDYTADSAELGKNVGDDLAEGKPTLPLIHAMREGSPAQRRLIRQAIEQGGLDEIEKILAIIESTGAIEYTAASALAASDRALQALAVLPISPMQQALADLARIAVERRS